MLTYPNIDPVAFHIGTLSVYWYGMMYVFGIGAAWLLALYRSKTLNQNWDSAKIDDLIFYSAIGVLVGGRTGYMLFYNFAGLLDNPVSFLYVREGGMSFHGGLVGVIAALWYLKRKYQMAFLDVGDFVAPLVPLGLGFGRLGNFINGELWGRVTNMPWGMVFPTGGPLPRHPSQLYELTLEGVVLFLVLWMYSSQPRPRGAISGLFLALYGLFRIFIECFRQPDSQLGFLLGESVTMGQLLSLPMMVIGVFLMYRAYIPVSFQNTDL